MYVDDCVSGSQMIAGGELSDPVNLGSSELVSINELVSITESIAGYTVKREYNLSAPQGVRGRNSDNTFILDRYGWEPTITLYEGMALTYKWIYDELCAQR